MVVGRNRSADGAYLSNEGEAERRRGRERNGKTKKAMGYRSCLAGGAISGRNLIGV